MTRGILVHKVQKVKKGNDGVPGAKGEQGPKGDTPDISNLVTKTQYTNDLNKRLTKRHLMLLVNIFLTMELLFTFKDQIQLLHVMLKEFLKRKSQWLAWCGYLYSS